MESAVATGKTITTNTVAKLVTVPKPSGAKASVPIVKVPSSGPTVTRVAKTSPQTLVMEVVRKSQPKRALTKGNKGPQVSGSNQYGSSENTRSQTKDRRKYATQAAVTSYEKIVVDVITSTSESEKTDGDVNQISDDELSNAAEEQPSVDEESNEEQ